MTGAVRLLFETGLGDFVVEADTERAPITAGNFVRLVESGAYDGGCFHRTARLDNSSNSEMADSVIGRGMVGDESEYRLPNDAYPICVVQASAQEGLEERPPIALERTSDTGLRHVEGAVSMSRQTPDSAVSDFFVCLRDEPELDFGGRRNPDGQGFAAFGRIVDGFETVQRIHGAPSRGQTLTPSVAVRRAMVLP